MLMVDATCSDVRLMNELKEKKRANRESDGDEGDFEEGSRGSDHLRTLRKCGQSERAYTLFCVKTRNGLALSRPA